MSEGLKAPASSAGQALDAEEELHDQRQPAHSAPRTAGRSWSIQMGSCTKHLRTEPIDHRLTVRVECGGWEVHTLTTDSIERTGCIPCLQKYYARVGGEQAQGGTE